MMTFYEQQRDKWIDLSVQNAFDFLLERAYNPYGKSDEQIARIIKDTDIFLKDYYLEDIESAVERYRERNNI